MQEYFASIWTAAIGLFIALVTYTIRTIFTNKDEVELVKVKLDSVLAAIESAHGKSEENKQLLLMLHREMKDDMKRFDQRISELQNNKQDK